MIDLKCNLTSINIGRYAISKFIKPETKLVRIFTFTLSWESNRYLNYLVALGITVEVIAAKINDFELNQAKYTLIIVPHNHIKMWIVDKEIYIGSANLVADTIANLMYRLPKKSADAMRAFSDKCFLDKTIDTLSTIILA